MANVLTRLSTQEFAVGTDATLPIKLYNTSRDPLDVSGLSATWKLFVSKGRRWSRPFRGNAVLEKTTDDDITLSAGLASIRFYNTDLAGLYGDHWQVIRITDESDNIVEYGQGILRLRAGF